MALSGSARRGGRRSRTPARSASSTLAEYPRPSSAQIVEPEARRYHADGRQHQSRCLDDPTERLFDNSLSRDAGDRAPTTRPTSTSSAGRRYAVPTVACRSAPRALDHIQCGHLDCKPERAPPGGEPGVVQHHVHERLRPPTSLALERVQGVPPRGRAQGVPTTSSRCSTPTSPDADRRRTSCRRIINDMPSSARWPRRRPRRGRPRLPQDGLPRPEGDGRTLPVRPPSRHRHPRRIGRDHPRRLPAPRRRQEARREGRALRAQDQLIRESARVRPFPPPDRRRSDRPGRRGEGLSRRPRPPRRPSSSSARRRPQTPGDGDELWRDLDDRRRPREAGRRSACLRLPRSRAGEAGGRRSRLQVRRREAVDERGSRSRRRTASRRSRGACPTSRGWTSASGSRTTARGSASADDRPAPPRVKPGRAGCRSRSACRAIRGRRRR